MTGSLDFGSINFVFKALIFSCYPSYIVASIIDNA